VRRLIISVSDLDRSMKLYASVLGLGVRSRGDDVAQLVTSEQVEVLMHQRPARPTDAGVAIGFEVRAIDRAVEAWTAAGGSVVDPPAEQPWGEVMATLRDLDGHLVCLSEVPAAVGARG
jgi:predicted enzyme related to lactoylglutathione lyase